MESNKIQINRKTKETDEKIKVIDIIIDMYPDLKKIKMILLIVFLKNLVNQLNMYLQK